MFVREKKSTDKTVSMIQIVENHRVGAKTKQRVVRYVGVGRTPEKIEQLKRLAEVLKAQLEDQARSKQNRKTTPRFASAIGTLSVLPKKSLIDVSNLKETTRLTLGFHDVYGHLYDHFGFTNLFTRPHQRENDAKILREIVLARIANPLSKRASVELLQEKFGVTLDLDHVYKMMDKIDDLFCERMQQRALTETLKLTGEKLRVLFYDATTLYFESFSEDDLKRNGYSKDLKFNQPQVLLALLVTQSGLPIGYELFPGNTFEGHTLIPVLERLQERYQLDDVIFVADRGLFSDENLAHLEARGFKYIVGARIKNTSKKLQEEILNFDHYKTIAPMVRVGKKTKEVPVQKIAQFEQGKDRKLIVHYSSDRARKDEHDRKDAIEKLYKKLAKSKDPRSLLSNYGYKKYLEIEGKAKIVMNQLKIENAAGWDGLVGVVTNMKEANPEQLLSYYRGLWQIEESFRINKHDLRMRPIYHWKPHRVRAHIAISFIAFVCVRYLEYLLSIKERKLSPKQIRKSLSRVQASIIKDKGTGKTFLLPAEMSADAKAIYRLIGIKAPAGITEIYCGA